MPIIATVVGLLWARPVTGLGCGWKPTNLTSVFTLQTSVFLASWYYAEGIDTDVRGC